MQATARMLGISTHAVYALFKKSDLPGRKVARRWLTARDSVLRWVLRAYAAASASTRSVKMRRLQLGFRPTNLRTASRRRTGRVPQGRSVRWR